MQRHLTENEEIDKYEEPVKLNFLCERVYKPHRNA